MMQAAPLITEELLDEDFFAELDALIDKDFEENKEIKEENRNCGTGAVGGKQGFQPGNKCAGDGEKSKGKAEGKKKDVHSDWDDGKTAAEAGWTHAKGGNRRVPGVLKDRSTKNFFHVKDGDTVFDTFVYAANGNNKSRDSDDVDGEALRTLVFTVEGSTELQGWGSAMQIMREVSNRTMSLYGDKNIHGFYFDAATSEGGTVGRAKLYKSLAKRLVRRKGGKAYASVTVDGYVDFYVIKPGRRSSGILETIKRNMDGKKLYEIDDFDIEKQLETFGQGGAEGRSVTLPSSAGETDLPKGFGLIEPLLEDEDFIAEVERMLESEENRNCGTGAVGGKQGFQPGNKCAGSGEKSKAKAEGKKKDVHSDWDDGATSDRYWTRFNQGKHYLSTITLEDEDGNERNFEMTAGRTRSSGETLIGPYLMNADSSLTASPVYSMSFADDQGRHKATGRGGAQKVFREVVNRAISFYDNKEVGVVRFSADRDETSRVKLYDFLSKFAAKRRGAKVFVDDNQDGAVVFHVTKPKYAEKYDEWHRKEDNPIYPIDNYEGEY